jgi:hypothetical protein
MPMHDWTRAATAYGLDRAVWRRREATRHAALSHADYVYAPLETTYMQSWAGVPHRWKRVIEAE